MIVPLEEIKSIINNYYNVDINKHTRKAHIKEPRQIYMKIARECVNKFEKPHTLANIVNSVGLKHHATCLHAIKTIDNLMDVEPKLKEDIEFLQNKIKDLKILVY